MTPPVAARIGWIGLGRMGRPMAERLLQAGHVLTVWSRDAARAAPLAAAGATVASDAQALARGCDVVVTIVGGPDDVRALHAAMMPVARPGTLFIDATTASPRGAREALALARSHGVASVDAPVTGGVAGAERGKLTSFVGGEPDAVARARPLLAHYSARIVDCGAAGSGQRMKLVNQTLMVGALLGLADGMRLARAFGADAVTLAAALGGGSAASAVQSAYLERMLDGAGAVTFTLGLLHKDLRLAHDEADTLGVPAPLLGAALAAVQAAIERHGADAGLQVLAAAG